MTLAEQMREGYAAYSRRDYTFMDDLFASDIEWTVPGPQGTLHSRDDVRGFFDGLAQQFSAHTIRLDDAVESGDRLVCFVTHRFSRPDGESADVRSAHDWQFRNGQVTRMTEYADTLAFAVISGMVSADAISQPA